MGLVGMESKKEVMVEEAHRILATVLPRTHAEGDSTHCAPLLSSAGLNTQGGSHQGAESEETSQGGATTDVVLQDATGAALLMRGSIYNVGILRELRRRGRHISVGKSFRTELTELFTVDWKSELELALQAFRQMEGMYALILTQSNGDVVLARDLLGMKSLYIGNRQGQLVAGFDLKTVAAAADEVAEFPPGHLYTPCGGLRPFSPLPKGMPDMSHDHTVCREMLAQLTHTVRASLPVGGTQVPTAVLLSGGVASSILTYLASRFRPDLHSVTVGVEGASDLEAARNVAAALRTTHHERIVLPEEVIDALPEVIFHLETFHYGAVRRALAYHFVASAARDANIEVALSGDGANALFAGDPTVGGIGGDGGRVGTPGELHRLHQEVLLRTSYLHRTNLPGADRMGHAHGLDIRLPYLDAPALVDLALRITPDLKVGTIEDRKLRGTGIPQRTRFGKRILREIALDLMPDTVASAVALRPRKRFEQGAGFKRVLVNHAKSTISNEEFNASRDIMPGVRLHNAEEMLYYRIFREMFPAERLLLLSINT